MTNAAIYRRPAFINRPWIRGSLYDTLARSTILHCDAYVFTLAGNEYLQLEWQLAGKALIAIDTYLNEPDGLTPVWDARRSDSVLTYSTDAALHARVVEQAASAMDAGKATGQFSRVSLLCHYIDARETNCEIRNNLYVERKPYAPRKPKLPALKGLPDLL